MHPILLINTALERAYVAISAGDSVLAEEINSVQKEHASFLHPAIKNVLKKAGLDMSSVVAVSVIAGPGSYTGLRVGMAAAKGLCYAASIPLISINTLEWMMASIKKEKHKWYVPMIDARRNEVFMGIYDKNGVEIHAPGAYILEKGAPFDISGSGTILFFGDGSTKAEKLISDERAIFLHEYSCTSHEHAILTKKKFAVSQFADVAYEEPLYAKEFYTTSGK